MHASSTQRNWIGFGFGMILAFGSIARAQDDSIPEVVPREFAIELVRPERVGNTFDASFRAEMRFSLRGGLQPKDVERAKTEELATGLLMEMDARVEILKVDGEGRVLKQALTVTQWNFDDNDDGPEFDLRRKVLIAETIGGETQFSIDGEPVNENHCELLRMIVTTYRGGKTIDDEFGSKPRRRIDDTWTATLDHSGDKPTFGRSLPGAVPLKKVLSSGVARLTRIDKSGDVPCLVLEAEFNCSNCPAWNDVSDDVLEKNVVVEDVEFAHSFSGHYPVDRAERCRKQRESFSWMLYGKRRGAVSLVEHRTELIVTREFRNAREPE